MRAYEAAFCAIGVFVLGVFCWAALQGAQAPADHVYLFLLLNAMNQ